MTNDFLSRRITGSVLLESAQSVTVYIQHCLVTTIGGLAEISTTVDMNDPFSSNGDPQPINSNAKTQKYYFLELSEQVVGFITNTQPRNGSKEGIIVLIEKKKIVT
jgi:hypothetical protein